VGNALLRQCRKLRTFAAGPRELFTDVLAGLQIAISSVPGGMATAALVGVEPIQGLYACFAGTIGGGLSAKTRLMVVSTTGAVALAAGSALRSVHQAQRPAAAALLTLLVGVALLAAGLLRLGRYTRFVSHSVMIGFLTGISVNIVCGQVAGLTGARSHGRIAVLQALSVLLHPGRIEGAALLTGVSALAILVVMMRTKAAQAGTLLAVVIPTIVVAAAGADNVRRVKDIGRIQPGIPAPTLPDFGVLSYGMITGALAVAAIIIVQGAGVSEVAASNGQAVPGGSRDVLAQGIGNLASSLWRGIPVGGALGDTNMNVKSGARTRFAAVAGGVWMGVILAAFSGAVGLVALPTLSAVLIFFGVRAFQPGQISAVWRTGPISQVAIITTCTATLLLPVAAAVGIGVGLSLILQLNRDAMDLQVVELIPLEDGRAAEAPPPDQLPSRRVTILNVYGSLLYAGSRTLQAKLPDPSKAESAALILRLRKRTSLGATFIKVISDYGAGVAAGGGRVYLSGLEADVIEQLRKGGLLGDHVRATEATAILGESTRAAFLDAESWLLKSGPRE